jgi:rhamnosyl/mannosyltransferase
MIRILHIGKFFPPFAGGMEHFLADLLPALQNQGIQTAALVHSQPFGSHHAFQSYYQGDANLPIYQAPCYGQLLYAPLSPSFPLRLARAIQTFKPDILHLHMPNTSAFWTITMPSARRIPWVIHWHSDVVTSHINRRLFWAYQFYRPLEHQLLAHSLAIIATSPPYLGSSQALRPWQAKCYIIPLGLNPARIPDPKKEALYHVATLWQGASFKVLAIGRLAYYKGFDFLIKAVADLANLRLLIVGKGELHSRLESLIKTQRLDDKVTLLGFQDEAQLSALFASCDVLCLPSLERTEAFGLVLLEAMRFQKPVIASDIPGSGVGWVVHQGGNGLLVKPADSDALRQALHQLQQQSPWQRQQLGKTGALSLQNTFHINRIAETMVSLYQKISIDTDKKH